MTSPAARCEPAEGPLGILAGAGRMPHHVAEAARAAGRPVHVLALRGAAEGSIEAYPHTWVSMGQVGRMLKALKENGCAELVIIGGVRRPHFGELRIDWGTLANLPELWKLTSGGDDSVLSRVVRLFEAKGLRVRGAHEIAPDLLASRGPLGRHAPSRQDQDEIDVGLKVAAALGRHDVGQAVVVARGQVIAVEAAEGTDAMLERCAELKRWGLASSRPRAGVLVKCAKPGQERRVDLPTIGPETVRRAAQARLRGIAVAAGDVLMADRKALLALADRKGLFVVGVTPMAVSGGQGA